MDFNNNTDNGYVLVRVEIPNAHSVYVHGSFNHWHSTATPMVGLGSGIWEAKLPPNTILDELCFYVIPYDGSTGHVLEWGQVSGVVEHEVVAG